MIILTDKGVDPLSDGTWDSKEQTVRQLTRIAEKPRCKYAKDFGEAFDIGNAEAYRDTVARFGRP